MDAYCSCCDQLVPCEMVRGEAGSDRKFRLLPHSRAGSSGEEQPCEGSLEQLDERAPVMACYCPTCRISTAAVQLGDEWIVPHHGRCDGFRAPEGQRFDPFSTLRSMTTDAPLSDL